MAAVSPAWADPEENLRGLAAAFVEEFAEDAHRWLRRGTFKLELGFDLADVNRWEFGQRRLIWVPIDLQGPRTPL